MALRNGLLVHGPTHWAAAVRAPRRHREVASGPKPRLRGRSTRVPLACAASLRLAEAFAVIPLVRRALPEARLPFEDSPCGAMGVAPRPALAGRLLGARAAWPARPALAVVSLAPALFALRDGELAAYHGVEHKAIGAYEPAPTDAADAPKEHDRCGSHLMAPMLVANLAGAVAAASGCSSGPAPLATGAVSLASVGRGASRCSPGPSATPDSPAARALKRPGYEIQRLFGTREPDEDQLEVGRAALPRSCGSRTGSPTPG